jgi:ethanolamine utilization protein EutN
MLGSGVGDFVLIAQGSSARFTPETQKLPIDCVVIGIVDTVNIEKKEVYSRTAEER